MMMANPRCAGGFLWDLMDQGVVRTDKNNYVDWIGSLQGDTFCKKQGEYHRPQWFFCPAKMAEW